MKSILIIDTPTHCGECPVKCRMRGINHVPTWCPLRPLPKPKEANHCADEEFALLDRMYRCGFNACLDEITGETE